MEDLEIHLTSDLHIDHWSEVMNKYPLGEIKNFPIKWKTPNKPTILIVAGDISDIMNLSIDYLDSISQYYDHVLFIDGNHEHVHVYPQLLEHGDFFYKTNIMENSKLVYLPIQDFVIKDIAIIGHCGWWNYSEGEDIGYFDGWIREMNNPIAEKEFRKQVKLRALEEARIIRQKLESYDARSDIKNVVIVTHTVPKRQFGREINVDHNSAFETIKSTKLKYWVFGHNHESFDQVVDGIRYISHPRGRPEDYDRVDYQPLAIPITKS